MKAPSTIVLLIICFINASFELASACSCIETSVEDTLYSDTIDTVFRGFAQRQQMTNETSPSGKIYYVVNVGRVFKGCTVQNETTIIVETSANPVTCGVMVDLKKNYVFSGNIVAAKPEIVDIAALKNPKIVSDIMVSVHLCNLNAEFHDLTSMEKSTLRNSTNVC